MNVPCLHRFASSRAEEILWRKVRISMDIPLATGAEPSPQIVPGLIFHQRQSQEADVADADVSDSEVCVNAHV